MGNWLWRNRQSPNVDIEVLTEHAAPIVVEGIQKLKWQGNWQNNQTTLITLSEAIQEGLSNPQN